MTLSDPPVVVERRGPVAILRMAMHERRNALSTALRDALITAMEESLKDSGCRAIVLTGTQTSFCAGGDLDALRDHDPLFVRERMQHGQQLVRLIAAGSKPVVAAVNGAAFGAGLSIAAACDVVIASPQARFCCSFTSVGLMPDLGLLWSLPRRIGAANARRMVYTGRIVDAQEAHALGLADELCEAQDLIDRAYALAQGFAGAPPVAMAMTRAALARDCASLEAAMAQELEGQTLLFSTDDFVEGVQAFKERRPARFTGR